MEIAIIHMHVHSGTMAKKRLKHLSTRMFCCMDNDLSTEVVVVLDHTCDRIQVQLISSLFDVEFHPPTHVLRGENGLDLVMVPRSQLFGKRRVVLI